MGEQKMTYEIGIGIGVMLLAGIIWRIRKHYKKLLQRLHEELKEVRHNFKSALVRFGKSWEHFIPFSKEFPGDKGASVFFGQPIDYVSFDTDMIRFIECKTGNSQLNKNQKRIKDLIDNKAVEFIELRY